MSSRTTRAAQRRVNLTSMLAALLVLPHCGDAETTPAASDAEITDAETRPQDVAPGLDAAPNTDIADTMADQFAAPAPDIADDTATNLDAPAPDAAEDTQTDLDTTAPDAAEDTQADLDATDHPDLGADTLDAGIQPADTTPPDDTSPLDDADIFVNTTDDATPTDDIADTTDTEPPPACRGTNPGFWRDLSGFDHDGAFFDLDDTVTWAGDGTIDAPYHLALGGTPSPRLELPATDLLRLESGSVELWLRPASSTFANKMVYNHRAGAEFAGVVLVSQDNQWKALATSNGSSWGAVFSAGTHAPNTWQHVVLTWENMNGTTTLRVHVNGAVTGSRALAGVIRYSDKGRAQLGGLDGDNGSFHGGIALARIWEGALTTAEIRALYNTDAATRFGLPTLDAAGDWPSLRLLASFDATPCP